MKILKIISIAALLVIGATVGGFFYFFSTAVPNYEGELTVEGLIHPVSIKTDDHGIPHIKAQNERDLYFAQGYMVARERLFQMDMTRLAGRGELSTVFGERTLQKDRFLRTIGIFRHAKASFKLLSDESKTLLWAYANGVNAFIDSEENRPREYFILGVEPEYWVPEDSIAAATLLGYSLTRSKKIDLVLHKIRENVGDDVVRQIIPHYPDFAPTLSQDGRIFNTPAELPPMVENTNLADLNQGENEVFDSFPFPLEIAASNWMIFSGKLTASGKPMFAGSPDLAPTLPGMFYIMHLNAGDIDIMGGVFPGLPGMGPLAFNGDIAYSAVNGRGDELDYFFEKLNPKNPDQYLTETGYREFEIIEETIFIKTDDGMQQEPLRIRVSRHGPMISNVLPDAPPDTAMMWAGLDRPALDIEGFFGLMKAKNIDDFRKAAEKVNTINLGLGYADKEGNIGWQFLASTPIRKKGDGSLPVPGWTGEYDWNGYVPFEQVPFEFNPPAGYVASFNNDPGKANYFTSNFYLFERAIRFRELMRERPVQKVTFAELKDMQLDTVSSVAARWVPIVLNVCESDVSLKTCEKLFQNWDYRIEMDSNAATLFNYFYLVFMGDVLKDDIGEEIWSMSLRTDYLYYVPDLVVSQIINKPNHDFYDDRETAAHEQRDDIIRRSMTEAIRYLVEKAGSDPVEWRWGDLHKMPFNHALGSKLSFLNLEPVSTNGSHHTINSGFWNTKKPFEMSAGGVIRIMVDFSNVGQSTIISPPGQSGHYLSPYYDDLVDMWARGDQVPMNFATSDQLRQTLTLLPRN